MRKIFRKYLKFSLSGYLRHCQYQRIFLILNSKREISCHDIAKLISVRMFFDDLININVGLDFESD